MPKKEWGPIAQPETPREDELQIEIVPDEPEIPPRPRPLHEMGEDITPGDLNTTEEDEDE